MSTCKGCGRDILWGVDEKGTRIPLDPRAPVYHVMAFDPETNTYAVERAGGSVPTNYVSHFATCPKAKDFSRSTRPTGADHRARAAGN
jgi:hypothetical protein